MSFTCRAITREIPRVVARHVTYKNDLHGKYLYLTRENMRDTTRGIYRVCKVVVELYRRSTTRMMMTMMMPKSLLNRS